MKKILLTLAAVVCAAAMMAQEKLLQGDQLMDRNLYPQRPMRGFHFVPGTDKVMYTVDTATTTFMLFDGKKETVISEEEHTKLRGELKGDPTYFDGKKWVPAAMVSNDGNLYVNGKLVAEGDRYNIVLGESVHRNEFGIDKGLFWSPRHNKLAFYRMDQSMVQDYPLVNTKAREAETMPVKYPMAGMKSHEVTVGVHDTVTGMTVYLDTRRDTTVHEREMYLTNIAWSPDEKFVYIAKVNRGQNHMWLEQYDAATGAFMKVLFEETNPRYVEPCEPMIFLPSNGKRLPGGDQFLWFSMRDGYKHLYLYNADGSLVKQVTKGEYEVEGFIQFDKKGENIFIYANKDNPTGRDAYRVSLKDGKMWRLTLDKGTHSVVLNADGTSFVDVYSSVEVPARAMWNSVKYGKNGQFSKHTAHEFYRAENPLKDYAMPTVKLGTLKAADGKTDLYYRLITPPNMKPGEKYPTLVYVYGGPHSQLVTDSWLGGGNLYFMFLAQQGYVVFTLDNRGTDNRGFEFESCTHRRLGEIEMADQMEGVKFLKSLPYVDQDRIGVEGWSFGGFMTITMKLAHPEVFKVGCAGGPVIDWKWYEIMYGERYMDTPQENPEGYEAASLLNKAKDLEGRLLVIHGAEDNTVVWQHSLEFIERCINNHRQVDYFVYPHHEHNVLGRERLHLYQKMFQYYEDHLK
ncbi:MAG: dipeptidyl aminopeptidase IV [bacterium P3]|nr:MAG: dipeptidyl aminopeptidase IV [bacterium P3]KWW41506.1 MAG: dipeptidyl aminopeptidase IV [bacterium F083]